jgi:tellurite resistance protein TerC
VRERLDGTAAQLVATPLFVVLAPVETTDVVFAVDSIPANVGVTRNPFLVYTSNVFAILGLRSMYFVLAGVIGKFHLLQYGLALVLAFVGTKMRVSELWPLGIAISLGNVGALLGGSALLSLVIAPKVPTEHPPVGNDVGDAI